MRQLELAIVDARSWLEYMTGDIPGAVLLNRDSEALPWQVECWQKLRSQSELIYLAWQMRENILLYKNMMI